MKTLKSYLYRQRFGLLGTGALLATLLLVGVLAHLPPAPLLYGGLLGCSFSLALHGYGYYRYQKQLKQVIYQGENWQAGRSQFPFTPDVLEEFYQQLVKELQQEFFSLERVQQAQMEDLSAYYTLWVHQVKTPIAAMDLLLKANADHPKAGALQQELVQIQQYAEMALQYIRLESFSSDLVLQEHNLEDLVHQTLKKLAPFFIYNKISLKESKLSYTFITDEKWFGFVLEQLLTNAVKYTQEGGVTLKQIDQKLYICDTGIGIAPEDLPRIFEQGYTGYTGRMDKKATGLGLPMSYRILQKLGHPISITSQLGQGTTVVIDLAQGPRPQE